jgi:hypothetical protein
MAVVTSSPNLTWEGFQKAIQNWGDGIHVFIPGKHPYPSQAFARFSNEVKSASAPLSFPFFRDNRIFAAE